MENNGILTAVLPELSSLKGCIQNRHHAFDVFEHTMQAYHYLEIILDNPSLFFPQNHEQFIRHMNPDISAVLKLSVLLHDTGKSYVKTVDDAGNIHFYGHAAKSAQLAQKVGQRLKLSNKEIKLLQDIVRYHIRPLLLFNAHRNNSLTRKGMTRFFLKCAHIMPPLLIHAVADTKAKREKTNKEDRACLSFIEKMAYDFFHNFKPKKDLPPFINGHDIIQSFGLVPSPSFKTILRLVEEARLSNKIKTKSQALSMVQNYLKNVAKNHGSKIQDC